MLGLIPRFLPCLSIDLSLPNKESVYHVIINTPNQLFEDSKILKFTGSLDLLIPRFRVGLLF